MLLLSSDGYSLDEIKYIMNALRLSTISWYTHYALGERPDLVVVVDSLLGFDWYRDNLRAVYPGLRVPAQNEDDWVGALMNANPTLSQLCRTNLEHAPPLVCEVGR